MTAPNPVMIRGVLYPSQAAAARALGVSTPAVYIMLEKGTIDNLGLGRNQATKKPVKLDGVEYESQGAMARAHGLNPEHTNSKIRKARKNGRKSLKLSCGVVTWE